jgi:hypothetical protein
METKTIEGCDAIHVEVSSEMNDPVDVKCGGPAVLGYDFYINPDEDTRNIETLIRRCMRKKNQPIMGVSFDVEKDYPVKNLWTRKMIEDCIKNNNNW